MLITILICLPIAWFGWTAVHELSHAFAVSRFRQVVEYRFRLYPHRTDGGRFVFASVQYPYVGVALDGGEQAAVSLAPRLPNLVALVLAPLGACLPWPTVGCAWSVLLGAALIDLVVGSVGWSVESDLRRAADALEIPGWPLRVTGFSLAAVACCGIILAWY